MHRNQALTIWNVVALLVLLVLAIGVLLPALGASRRTARCCQNSTQTRGIQGAFVLFSQGNNQWYPGMTGDGLRTLDPSDTNLFPATQHPNNRYGDTASSRLALLLNNNYFSGDYALSPAENKATIWTTGEVTTNNFSYALLQIDRGTALTSQGRRGEWNSITFNSTAPVLCAKSIDLDPGMSATSLWVTRTGSALANPQNWRGEVGWNDNHVSFEISAELQFTKYGKIENKNDNLFTNADGAATTANAAMVYD